MNRVLRLTPRKLRNARLFSNGIKDFESLGTYEELFPEPSKEEAKSLLRSSQCVYAGFDPTADSLHIGNLLILTSLLRWQRAGHQVIALLGGATGKIGDPSFRTSQRQEISDLVLNENLTSIREDIERIFANHRTLFWKKSPSKLKAPILLDNMSWYEGRELLTFIREIGTQFRMGTMLGRAAVQSRLKSETGMSFAEFTYPIFQAYDWLHLFRTHQCRFQIGGNDQMGNMVAGYDLIGRTTKENVFALTLPLLTAQGGRKFGKSTGNVIWLAKEKSSCFQLYQYFLRARDDEVEKLLRLYTFLDGKKIDEIVKEHFVKPEARGAQKILAEQVTLLVHGEDGLAAAKRASSALYDTSVENLANFTSQELLQIFEGSQIVELCVEDGLTIYELAMRAKCFKSEHHAHTVIEAGGFYVNHQRIINPREAIVPGIHILKNNVTLLRVGKKTYYVVRWL